MSDIDEIIFIKHRQILTELTDEIQVLEIDVFDSEETVS